MHVGIAGAVVAISAVTFQAATEQRERAMYPPPGRLVDIGNGDRIHLRTWGTPMTGSPTIVLDGSAGMPSSEWAWVGQALGERGFVVAYDRPGMAWSEGPKRPRDAMSAADALSRALTAADIEPPYVVVAHSYGGFSARAFVGMQTPDVDGLVLLDTTHPDGGGEASFALAYRLQALRAHAGLFALFGAPDAFAGLPPDEQAAADAVSHWTTHLDTTAEELEAWTISAESIRPLTFGDLPVLVVSAQGSDEHRRQQRDLLSLSSDSTFLELPVDHVGMLVDRAQAQLTARAITDFVEAL